MTGSGLGCAKTPAVAPHVEISLSNCICGSQIILHKRRSMPCRRIVFSTFRGCMSFYTGSVKLGRAGDVRCTTALPPKAEVDPRSCYVANVPILFSNSGSGCQALHNVPCRVHC